MRRVRLRERRDGTVACRRDLVTAARVRVGELQRTVTDPAPPRRRGLPRGRRRGRPRQRADAHPLQRELRGRDVCRYAGDVTDLAVHAKAAGERVAGSGFDPVEIAVDHLDALSVDLEPGAVDDDAPLAGREDLAGIAEGARRADGERAAVVETEIPVGVTTGAPVGTGAAEADGDDAGNAPRTDPPALPRGGT